MMKKCFTDLHRNVALWFECCCFFSSSPPPQLSVGTVVSGTLKHCMFAVGIHWSLISSHLKKCPFHTLTFCGKFLFLLFKSDGIGPVNWSSWWLLQLSSRQLRKNGRCRVFLPPTWRRTRYMTVCSHETVILLCWWKGYCAKSALRTAHVCRWCLSSHGSLMLIVSSPNACLEPPETGSVTSLSRKSN